MIKVLFVNPFSDLSGPEHVILRLMRGLDPSRFSSALVCPSDGRLARAARACGFDLQFVPLRIATVSRNIPGQALHAVAVARQLAGIVRAGSFDVVHVNSHRVGVPCSLAARLGGAASLWHIHEIYQTSSLRRRTIVSLAKLSAGSLVAVSEAVADQFRPCAKLQRIYNGIDREGFSASADGAAVRRELGFSADHLVVGSVGRLSPQKGQDIFLRAAALVAASQPMARFVLAGDEALGEAGFRNHLVELTGALGLRDKVALVGYRSDVASVLAAMDVFVHPTVIPDSLPNVILEAMALGRPVVATATGGSPELVIDGDTGLLVHSGDVDELAAQVVVLLADGERRDRFGIAAAKRVAEHFSYREHIERFEGLYEHLAGFRKRGNV